MTLSDVAAAAGVSSITVSRALRSPEIVSPPLRETILRLVDEMGYVPDFAARALASKNSGTFAVLVPSMAEYLFMSVMSGIEERVRTSEFRIQYANSHMDAEEEMRQLKQFLGQNPAGIIVSDIERHESSMELLKRVGCPIVQIMDISLPPIDMGVGINHYEGGRAATEHLLSCGYRRIGLIGNFGSHRAQRRLQAFREVLAPLGLFDPARVVTEDGPSSMQSGAMLMARLLDTVADVDAVFCRGDDIALGALFECQRRGIRVPEDLGICGYSDLSFAGVAVPSLTTIELPRFEMGYTAVDMLIDREAGKRGVPATVDLGFRLVVRGSTRQGPAMV